MTFCPLRTNTVPSRRCCANLILHKQEGDSCTCVTVRCLSAPRAQTSYFSPCAKSPLSVHPRLKIPDTLHYTQRGCFSALEFFLVRLWPYCGWLHARSAPVVAGPTKLSQHPWQTLLGGVSGHYFRCWACLDEIGHCHPKPCQATEIVCIDEDGDLRSNNDQLVSELLLLAPQLWMYSSMWPEIKRRLTCEWIFLFGATIRPWAMSAY